MASHPAKIGKYRVEGILGRGGMGVVYKAVDPQIGRYVAIKMITSDGDQKLLERFKSEARSTGSLLCPNIVTVYDFGEQEGNPYLVMQFLEGSSLEAMIQKRVSLTLSEKLGILIDVCTGLAYAHQRGVIHRDIKPANIMVLQDGANDGTAVIVDFGIAQIGGDTRLTRPDQIVGSVHYMSAEQLQSKELDNRTDIYAAGVVLFQLLTGVLPFDAPDTAATLLKIINDPPPRLSAYLRDYPIELEAIVGKVLAKKREERYASIEDLAFDLGQVKEQVKFQTAAQLVRRAESAISREEWTKAREQLQQVLRVDRQNVQAQKLLNAVQERLRQQQQIEQSRVLRSKADEACMDQRYDDAMHLLDQAVTLDTKNDDLLSFRESVRAARERMTGLRRALRRAEAALQDGDLDEAQTAVEDALKIDPHDTQAKAIKAIVSQHTEEKLRQEQSHQLLDLARQQIAARDWNATFATLKSAEALDPTSSELHNVAKMAAAAREQDKRRLETEELRRQIESAMVREDYGTAVARAEEGLRKFPQEQSLLRLGTLAEAQRVRVEQKKFVREQFATSSALIDSGQLPQALTVLDRALQRVPGNNELEKLRTTVRERMASEESERRNLEAIETTIAEGKRILQKRGARSAREFLDAHAGQYSGCTSFRELYGSVRSSEAIDALENRLAQEANPAKQLQFAEEALRSDPDNQSIRLRLAGLQQVRVQISAAIDRAQSFEGKQKFADALREWQELRNAYPQISEFGGRVVRITNLLKESKKRKPPPAVTPALVGPGPSKHDESGAGLSATRVLDSLLGRSTVTSKKPAPPIGVTSAATEAKTTKSSVWIARVRTFFATGVTVRTFLAGSRKYLTVAAVAIILAAGYLVFRGDKQQVRTPPPPTQVHFITTPADAMVTSGSKPLSNGMVSLLTGMPAVVDVMRLGYKTKTVEIRQESDGKIALEPEPLHVSIQTSEKSGTVEWDGTRLEDLANGNLDEVDLTLDIAAHQLRVTARGKPLFTLKIQAAPGSLPQVDSFDADGLFLITSLGSSAKLYAGDRLKNFHLDGQDVEASPSGIDLNLRGPESEIEFGVGSEQGSVAIERSNWPAISVYSANMGGQVLIKSNIEGANLTVNGAVVKRQRNGWLVSRPPGSYTFELSAEGYGAEKWTMTLQRRQILPNKNVDLKVLARPVALASLVIADGTSGAVVIVDETRVGQLDEKGSLKKENLLAAGQHTIRLTKSNYESRSFPVSVSAKQPEVSLPDSKLSAWPKVSFQTSVANVTVTYRRTGETEPHQVSASDKLSLPPGPYDFVAEAPGFEKFITKLNLAAGYEGNVPLEFKPIPDYQFQDATQVVHQDTWLKLRDPHTFAYLKRGLVHENLIFSKPGKKFGLLNKKVEWKIENSDLSAHIEYILEGQKLVHKVVIDDETPDTKEVKVDITTTQENVLSVHIQVDGSRVVISNDSGVILDDITLRKHSFSGGRIGIKTESQFMVRDKPSK